MKETKQEVKGKQELDIRDESMKKPTFVVFRHSGFCWKAPEN